MKKYLKNGAAIFIFMAAVLFTACFTACPPDNGENGNSGEKTVTSNEQGTHSGYDYEFWLDNRGGGSGKMILKEGGTFSCEWKNGNSGATNFLARKGFRLGSVKAANQYTNVSVDYSTDYQNQTGQSYMCVYGWTQNPLKEYYILDDFKVYNPATGSGAQKKGSFTVDGSNYDIYVSTRYQQPSIEGTQTFEQYWSIRTSKRQSGTISVSEHFKKWQALGMNMNGKLYEVTFCIEGYASNGNVNVTKNEITY